MLVQNFPPAAYVLNVLSQSKRSAASVRSYLAGLQLRLLLLLRLELYQTVMPETAPHMEHMRSRFCTGEAEPKIVAPLAPRGMYQNAQGCSRVLREGRRG